MGRRNVLVTGAHRTGTTWTARMLALAPTTCLVDAEPFNCGPRGWALDGAAPHWYFYVPGAGDRSAAETAAARVRELRARALFSRRRLRHWLPLPRGGRRLVVKDPLAAMSAEWFAERLDARLVVLVRHPVAFYRSVERMGYYVDFTELTGQPQLLTDHLGELAGQLAANPQRPAANAALLWRAVYAVLQTYADRVPGCVVVRHEDLSSDPVTRFERLYAELGLPWDARVAAQVDQATGAGNPAEVHDRRQHHLRRDSRANTTAWMSRVGTDVEAEIRAVVEPVSRRWYADSDWRVPAP